MSHVPLVSLISIVSFAIACGTGAERGDNTDDALRHASGSVGSVTPEQKADDAALTAMLAAPTPLTAQRADAITVAAIGKTVTLRRMKSANQWAVKQPVAGEGFDRITYAVSVLYMGAPRDLAFAPSGQSFETPHKLGEDGTVEPIGLKVAGTATAAYQLDFHVAGHGLSVTVPKGSTAAKTAALISDAINHDKSAIQRTWSSTRAIGGGDAHGFDDWSIDVAGATVTVSISINS